MAEIKFSQLTTAAQLTNDDIFALAQMQGGSLSSVKTSMIAVANYLNTQVQYTTAYNTQAKTTAGAINELKQLISLIPQFSIEVVEELPTEDISDTTIYLVPAEDPEVGNYYEEYIHVNDAWELVGTTAVDLSAYYTKLEVDGLLATKASVTEVALKENKSDMPTDVRTIIKDCKTPKSATITNGIAQFECIEENLVKGLKITMSPIQSGSGNPSPTNIRPITGRTEASVTRTGANQWDEEPKIGYTIDGTTGNEIQVSNVWCSKNYTLLVPNTNYYLKSPNYLNARWYDKNKNYLGYSVLSKDAVFNSTIAFPNARYLRFNGIGSSYNNDISINYPSTDTAYHAYNAETHTHQYSETIYGGVDDFVSGGATITYGMVDLGTLDWIPEELGRARVNSVQIVPLGIKWSTVPMCSSYKGVLHKGFNAFEYGEIGLSNVESAPQLRVKSEAFIGKTNEEIKAMMSGVQLCYELATPTTIETSAEEITTVAGTNIISGTEPISECQYTELATVDDLRKIIGGQ